MLKGHRTPHKTGYVKRRAVGRTKCSKANRHGKC